MVESGTVDPPALDGVDPGWAQALAPVEAELAAMAEFLRDEAAAGRPYLPADEHILRAFARRLSAHGGSRRRRLAGQMKAVDGPVVVRCAPAARSVDARDLWAGWGIRPRTSLELSVCAPMPPVQVIEVAESPSHVELGARRVTPSRAGDDADRAPRSRTTGVREA